MKLGKEFLETVANMNIPKPQTNSDRIRQMSDEELASFIASQQVSVINEFCKEFDCQAPDIAAAATAETLAWLKSPVEVDNGT